MRHLLSLDVAIHLVVLAALVLPCNSVSAAEPAATVRSAVESQLWLVSTRDLPHGSQRSSRRLRPDVERYDSAATWQPSSLDELILDRDPRLVTVLFVHGNDTDQDKARSKGLGIYRALSEAKMQPVRMIVWSWPADYVGGTLRHDARVKADRTEADAWLLAQFILELDDGESISLVGYSFGARLISGALHLLGGGSLAGQSLDCVGEVPRITLRAILVAAAFDNDWLLPDRRFGRALNAVDRLVILVNPQDRVLRWYRFLSPGSGAAALGARGIASTNELAKHRSKIEEIDVGPLVGVQHRWSTYAASAEVLEQIKRETVRLR